MKRFVIVSGVIVLVAIAGVAVALARSQHRRGWCRYGGFHHGSLGYVSRELNLSDTQKSRIKSIWQADQPTVSAQFREFAAEDKEMDTATTQPNVDESKIQEIANRQGATIAKLLVEKERLKSQVYTTVLSPEQRIKADTLETRWHSSLYRIADRMEARDGDELSK